jgi:phosphate transport system substrate-binding protein
MRSITRFATVALAIGLLALGWGCGKKAEAPKEKTSIDIKGSDTMVNLMSALAEAYMKAHPDKQIAVTGGGSGTGIAALLNGTTDICASSRSMQQKEVDLATSKNISPKEIVIGMDGLAVFVNPANTVDTLTLSQLKQIFQATVTDWKDVGGTPGNIVVLSRENNSGTYVYFKEHVLEKGDFSPSARLMTSTAALTQEIQTNATGIGYGGEAYGKDGKVKMLHVKKDAEAAAVYPTDETVRNGSYPIARPLYLYTNGAPAGLVGDFITFCNSPAGQAIVTEVGYVSMKG